MKLLLLPWALIIVIVIGECSGKKPKRDQDDDDGGSGGGGAAEFQGLFKKFFSNPKESSKAFTDFLQESGKKMGMKAGGGDKKEDKKEDKEGDEETEEDKDSKKPAEIPLPGKVFAFYGRTYGCTNSKVYQEFIKQYKDGKLPTPPSKEEDAEKTEKNDKWLKQLSKKDVEVTDSSKPSVEEAEGKLSKLEDKQKKKLDEGEAGMPMEAQMFLRFVKVYGCQDKNVGDYKIFNAKMVKEIEANKSKKKPPPPSYYLSKADTLLRDDPDLQREE